MLRKAALALSIAFLAACGDAPDPAAGLTVRGDDGTALGQVASVERDAAGRIIAADIPGLEPADAPDAADDMVAEDDRFWVRTSTSANASTPGLAALR